MAKKPRTYKTREEVEQALRPILSAFKKITDPGLPLLEQLIEQRVTATPDHPFLQDDSPMGCVSDSDGNGQLGALGLVQGFLAAWARVHAPDFRILLRARYKEIPLQHLPYLLPKDTDSPTDMLVGFDLEIKPMAGLPSAPLYVQGETEEEDTEEQGYLFRPSARDMVDTKYEPIPLYLVHLGQLQRSVTTSNLVMMYESAEPPHRREMVEAQTFRQADHRYIVSDKMNLAQFTHVLTELAQSLLNQAYKLFQRVLLPLYSTNKQSRLVVHLPHDKYLIPHLVQQSEKIINDGQTLYESHIKLYAFYLPSAVFEHKQDRFAQMPLRECVLAHIQNTLREHAQSWLHNFDTRTGEEDYNYIAAVDDFVLSISQTIALDMPLLYERVQQKVNAKSLHP